MKTNPRSSPSLRLLLSAVVSAACLAPGAAGATVQTLTASAVEEVEYYANTTSETWICKGKPVRLRLQVNFNGGAPVEVFRDRARISFNTASIPDNASILSVELEVYVRQSFTFQQPVEFKRLPIAGPTCFGKYIQIGNGLEYTEDGIQFGYTTIDLGPDAAADLQAQLGQDVFRVGLKMKFEGLGDYSDAAELSAQNDPEPHRLKVTYLVNGEGKQDPVAGTRTDDTSWGAVKGLFR